MRFSGCIYGHSFFSCLICPKLACAEFVAFWSSIILSGHEKFSISSDDKEEATNQSQDPVVYNDICPLLQHELPHQEFMEFLFCPLDLVTILVRNVLAGAGLVHVQLFYPMLRSSGYQCALCVCNEHSVVINFINSLGIWEPWGWQDSNIVVGLFIWEYWQVSLKFESPLYVSTFITQSTFHGLFLQGADHETGGNRVLILHSNQLNKGPNHPLMVLHWCWILQRTASSVIAICHYKQYV